MTIQWIPKFITFIASLFLITGCHQSNNHSNRKRSIISKKEGSLKKIYPLTDSGQLMLHLDSLSRPPFPYLSEGRNYSPLITVSLANFKNKALFGIPVKLIPTVVGGGVLDHADNIGENGILPDSIKETFNLVDSVTFKVKGVLVATKPKFILIDLDGTLVTMTYNVEIIDAIISSEGYGNNHFRVWRETTIKKDLTLIIRQYYTNEMPGENDKDIQYWFIDSSGHFKKS